MSATTSADPTTDPSAEVSDEPSDEPSAEPSVDPDPAVVTGVDGTFDADALTVTVEVPDLVASDRVLLMYRWQKRDVRVAVETILVGDEPRLNAVWTDYNAETSGRVKDVDAAWDLDAGTITFTLRDGAKFHSGNPVRAEDVVFSFARVIKLNLTPAFILAQLGWTTLALRSVTPALLRAGVAVNLGCVVLWAATRAWGLPLGLMPTPEPVGPWDLAAAAWELGAVAACAALLRARPPTSYAGLRLPAWVDWHRGAATTAVVSVLALLVLSLSGAGG